MTGYELFERAYKHFMGQFIRHIVHTSDKNAAKEYVRQSFVRMLGEYCIELLSGYWLCFHDGHTGDWMLIHYVSKSEAKDAYKRLYMRYFRHQDWFWIVKV